MSLNTRQVPGTEGGRGCLEGFTEEGAFQTRTERGAHVSQEGEGALPSKGVNFTVCELYIH